MKCTNPNCYNNNPANDEYCDRCLQIELNNMSYEELSELYVNGASLLTNIEPNDVVTEEMLDLFKKGWFVILNLELMGRINKEEKDE